MPTYLDHLRSHLDADGRLNDFIRIRDGRVIFADVLERGSRLGVFNLGNVRIMENMIPLMCSAWALKRWNLQRISKEEYTETLSQFILQGIGAPVKAGAGPGATSLDGKNRRRERKVIA